MWEDDTFAKTNRAALVSNGTSDAKMRAASRRSRPNSKLQGGNFELEMELDVQEALLVLRKSI